MKLYLYKIPGLYLQVSLRKYMTVLCFLDSYIINSSSLCSMSAFKTALKLLTRLECSINRSSTANASANIIYRRDTVTDINWHSWSHYNQCLSNMPKSNFQHLLDNFKPVCDFNQPCVTLTIQLCHAGTI